MKLLIYNIAYGTGTPGGTARRLLTSHRYLYTNSEYFDHIAEFIDGVQPDVIGLLEVDNGSFRTNQINQVARLAERLNHFHICDNKYGLNSPGRIMPIFRNQTNAIVTSNSNNNSRFHYFPRGFKKLIIEIAIDGIMLFLVHLSIRKNTRAKQLAYLQEIVPHDKPVIIAGDFNTFGGEQELTNLKSTLQLFNPNIHQTPSYPSWKPKHQLDYILCSKHIRVMSLTVPKVKLSDHLPLIAEIIT